MTRDDFQNSAGNKDKKNQRSSSEGNGAKVVPIRPQPQGPSPPAPRPPMPKAPFGAYIIPVATRIKVLPEPVKSVSRHLRSVEREDAKDE